MSVIRKDLGIATAYGYAVSKGYTGTEEEFAELMASYATVAEEAQEAAEQATQAVQTAQAAANSATTKAGEAATSASGAVTSASQAGQSATAAAGSASTASAKAAEAGTSATNAAASETAATQAAQTATTKAGEASASATAASQSATAAAGSASDASDDADRAETAAGSVSAAAEQIATNTADIAGLKDDLNTKAPAILAETNKEFSHVTLHGADNITFYGSNLAFDTAHYADKKQLLPGGSKTWTSNGADLVKNGNFVTINGTPSSTSDTIAFEETFEQSLPAGTYKLIVKMNGVAVRPSSCRFQVRVQYDVESPSYVVVYSQMTGGASFDATFDAENAIKKIRVYVGYSKDYTYSNFIIWTGIYQNPVNIIDTEVSILDSTAYNYTSADLYYHTVIDSMMHESIVEYVADTKHYIDEHVPDIKTYWTEEIYALPEKFGAVGNGVADDTQAVLDCISYAKTSGKAVRGFGKYKTTAPIVLDAKWMDVYLKEITYTGNQFAVEIVNYNIRFDFHLISSNAIGIRFGKTNVSPIKYGRMCEISGNAIESEYDCIYAVPQTIYNTCKVRRLSSANGNCITFEQPASENEFRAGEWVFESSTCTCPNGYVASNVFSSKMYNFTVESDCKYGLLNPNNCLCVGWRHREQIDGMKFKIFEQDATHNNGALIVFTSNALFLTNGFKYISQDPIFWFNIDLSAISGFDEIDDINEWEQLGFNDIDLGVPVRGVNQNAKLTIGNQVYFIGNNLVCTPAYRSEAIIDIATLDFRYFDSRTDADIISANNLVRYLCTDFVTAYSHSDVYLNAFFGAVGYNDLTVTQKDGNTVTIYDKVGGVLFDGTNKGNGKWHLACSIDKTSFGRFTGTNQWWVYDGTNEIWEIEKIE